MSAATMDPIIRAAQERLRAAAQLIERGQAEILAALRPLEAHPDFIKTARQLKGAPAMGPIMTYAWWVASGIRSTLEDLPLEDAVYFLREDGSPRRAAATMRKVIEDERRDLARIAQRNGSAKNRRPHAAGTAAQVCA